MLTLDDTLSLPEALALALQENPRLRSFAWEVRAREAQVLQAGLYPNPTLSAEAESLPTDAPFDGFSGAEQSVRLGVPLELWGRPWKRRDVAEATRDLAGWTYEAVRLDVTTQVTQAFIGVLAAQERVRLAEALVGLSKEVYQTVRRQVEAGKVSPVEQTRARVPLSEARIQLSRARQSLAAARNTLAGTWGRLERPPFEAVTGTFGPVHKPPSLRALQPLAARNPRIARQQTNIRQAEARLALEKASRFPIPKLTAGWQRFGGLGTEAFTAGIALPLPLFDRNQGATQRARYRVQRAQAQREDARVQVDTALTRAYHRLAASYNEVRTLRSETLPAARSAFKAIRQGYRAGKFSSLDVLDAQRTLFDVRRQEVRALSDYYQRRATVERLIATPLAAVTNE
ncbi:TolC family protein [Salisaeta longa]|uniref:TolC family protein n=1 Tax=Salisaeta longa TaxID=503170 RepID=UPI00041096E1|nr:TolC family protein [Salisaeta longa]